jgi:hypothetical protein
MRLISDSSECYFLDNRCEWPIKSCDLPLARDDMSKLLDSVV